MIEYILCVARAKRIDLDIEGDNITYSAPIGAVDEHFRGLVADHYRDLHKAIRTGCGTINGPELAFRCELRAAIDRLGAGYLFPDEMDPALVAAALDAERQLDEASTDLEFNAFDALWKWEAAWKRAGMQVDQGPGERGVIGGSVGRTPCKAGNHA
jgi:hypothetical protein